MALLVSKLQQTSQDDQMNRNFKIFLRVLMCSLNAVEGLIVWAI